MMHRSLYYLIAILSIFLSRQRPSHEGSRAVNQSLYDSFSVDELFV
jgi:hypothetical protein